MSLTEKEKNKYNRHLIIESFGEESQLKIKNAKVLIVGAGGLGCPVIQYLTAAGTGKIGIIDGDNVSLSNLQRQIIYNELEVGLPKAEVACDKMKKLNSEAEFVFYKTYLTENFADEIFPQYDLIVGATDNFKSRYIIDKKCKQYNKPWIHGAIYEFEGQVAVFNYQESITYSELFEEQPDEPSSPIGVIGAIPGVIGSLMAIEAIKLISGKGNLLCNRILIYNALDNCFRIIKCR